MAYEMTGTVKVIKDTQTSASGSFTWREFVITNEEDRYPQDILFRVTKDRCSQLDSISVGERLKLTFDIRGREYQGRFFVNLEAFRIERPDVSQDAPAADEPVVAADEPPLDDAMPF